MLITHAIECIYAKEIFSIFARLSFFKFLSEQLCDVAIQSVTWYRIYLGTPMYVTHPVLDLKLL